MTNSDDAANRLRELGGPRLYRRNAFRLTGLATDVESSGARARVRQLTHELTFGDAPEGAEPDELRAALTALRSPGSRVVDELFWLWGEPGACGCSKATHTAHDKAVRAHSRFLDAPAAGGALWASPGKLWTAALDRREFWNHVRHRADTLDHEGDGAGVLAVLRSGMGATLVEPLLARAVTAAEPAPFVAAARSWPVPARAVEDRLRAAADPLAEQIEVVLDRAVAAIEDRRPGDAAAAVDERVLGLLQRLDGLAPHQRHRRTAELHDGLAGVLVGAAVVAIDHEGLGAEPRARGWLSRAATLAVGTEAKATVAARRSDLDEIMLLARELRAHVAGLLAAGDTRTARAYLLHLRRTLADSVLAPLVEELLAGLGTRPRQVGHAPLRSGRAPVPGRLRSRTSAMRRRLLDLRLEDGYGLARGAIVCAGILFAAFVWPGLAVPPAYVPFVAASSADNASIGSCISTEELWEEGLADAEDSCGEPHFGEILGYPVLNGPYPGDDQANALVKFECGRMLAARVGASDDHTYGTSLVTADSWAVDPYAACVALDADGGQLPAGRLPDAGAVPDASTAAEMSLFSTTPAQNAPVGACVRDPIANDAETYLVAAVNCTVPHWAEILGYVTLFEPGSPWPGDDAVYATALQACEDLAGQRSLPPELTLRVIWPAQTWWDDPQSRPYTTCLAHRADGAAFTGRAGA